MEGKTINGFTIKSLLGVGGMAEVWLAENALGKKVAVKLLLLKFSNDENIVARFQNEAKVMVQLDHPNIRQVYDYGTIDGRPAIVMEYLEGDDLKALMKSGRRFTDAELRKWWNQIADALNYTHAEGVVHRDIKPSNLFLDKKGNIKLLDFGIAKIRESLSMTQTGAMMGTLMYMSPEQVRDSKHIDGRSDEYSLAVCFVHLLTGKAPYDSTDSDDYTIRKGIVEIPLDLSTVPADWREFLAPYLAKNPEERPALRSFEVMASETPVHAAMSADEGTIINDAPKKPWPQPSPNRHSGLDPLSLKPKDKPKSKKTLWIALAVAAVAAIVVLFFLHQPKQEPVPVDPEPEELPTPQPITGTANGHDYVDLGLPSGTLWATCNIGANNPEDYGNYYAWGETYTKSTYNWDTYKYGSLENLTKYCNNSRYGYYGFTDTLVTLQGSDDPAVAIWGGGWHTPSKTQLEELLANTTVQLTTQQGVAGLQFTSKKNGKTLFLPAVGFQRDSEFSYAGSHGLYWSRSLYTGDAIFAWGLHFRSDFCGMYLFHRDTGISVRPVREN